MERLRLERNRRRLRRSGGLAACLGAALLTAGRPDHSPACDSDNGGITLPAGFCAVVVADQVGAPRHLAVAPNGDLFVAMAGRPGGAAGGILPLRDTSGGGKADRPQSIGSGGGTGIAP